MLLPDEAQFTLYADRLERIPSNWPMARQARILWPSCCEKEVAHANKNL
jgi:hypothetical protein